MLRVYIEIVKLRGMESVVSHQICSIFLQLASQEQLLFKRAVSTLRDNEKAKLEECMRTAIEYNSKEIEKNNFDMVAPRIKLKQFA